MTGQAIGRALLAAFFIVGGVMHFVLPDTYARVMPAWLGWHAQLVAISGVCEIAGGIGVLVPRVRRLAGWGLILLSLAVLPANVQMLLSALQESPPAWQIALLVLRLPLQAALIWWIWRMTNAGVRSDIRTNLVKNPSRKECLFLSGAREHLNNDRKSARTMDKCPNVRPDTGGPGCRQPSGKDMREIA